MSQEQIQVPKGWKEVTLEDCISSILGGDWGENDIESLPEDYVRVKILRATEISNWSEQKGKTGVTRIIKKSSLEKRQLAPNDLILEISGGSTNFTVGRCVLIDEEVLEGDLPVICANFFRKIRLKDDVNPKFIHYLLHNFHATQKMVQYISKSTNIQNLKVPKLLSHRFVIPPLATQKKIVQKLDDILGQLEEKKKQILELLDMQQERTLLLSDNYLSFKTAELIPVENAPEHWKLMKLGETFDEYNKKWLPNSKSEMVNYIALENIESNTGVLVRFTTTDSSKIKSSKTVFTKKMVLYGKLRPYLNKVLLPSFDGICSTDILPLAPKSNIDREFLAYFLRSWHVLSNVKKSMHGTKMPRTKIQVLQEVPIALPPLDEQKEILKKIKQNNETTNNIKNSIQKIHEKAERLIQYQNHIQSSILDTAFSGKLLK